ncbi:MAG: tRNA (N6-threonylcarbamoyladenosine(37)-N6)-methyltransferase TrmO [Prevotella sp.]|nr:tRNA (N6-threonylcarbamoyladenosine(37)-N6)-methyltransferase TrmO [Prevotella sp.]
MTIEPVAFFRSPFTTKFGIPRQSGLVSSLTGRIEFTDRYRHAEAVRGLEGFDYVWLIWGFCAAKRNDDSGSEAAPDTQRLTVRPPRLGGNERVGVFASRSPFRPNGLGLSSVRIVSIGADGNITVSGADLMDGTPIYDVKPYVPYADAHPEAAGGFTDTREWKPLEVTFSSEAAAVLTTDERQTLADVLALDPRPHYHDSPDRIYGMPFAGSDVRFKVSDGKVTVLSIIKFLHNN